MSSIRHSIGVERAGRVSPPELIERRDQLKKALAGWKAQIEPQAREEHMRGMRVLRFTPSQAPRACLVHFHGGGYRLGCPEMIGSFASALAECCRVTVLCPAYRLAPEHPMPAALNDGWSLIAEHHDHSPLILSGDSAGGGLAASLTAVAHARGLRIAALCLLSPWLDLTVSSSSYETHAQSDALFSREAAREAADLYLQGVSPSDPLASPLFAPAEHFPATFISVGASEVLLDDARHFHAALCAAGVEATCDIVPAMEHAAMTRNLGLPGAAQSFDALVQFIDARLAALSSGR